MTKERDVHIEVIADRSIEGRKYEGAEVREREERD